MITACIAFAIDYYLDPDSIYTKQLRQNGELITHNKDESVFVFLRLDDLIQDDGVYIHPSQTLGDIVQIMSRERHDDYFPVLDNEKHLLGIVRLNDVREDLFNPQKYGNPITRYMLLSPTRSCNMNRSRAYCVVSTKTTSGCYPSWTRRNTTWATSPNRES